MSVNDRFAVSSSFLGNFREIDSRYRKVQRLRNIRYPSVDQFDVRRTVALIEFVERGSEPPSDVEVTNLEASRIEDASARTKWRSQSWGDDVSFSSNCSS
jgi:hypothetical protein